MNLRRYLKIKKGKFSQNANAPLKQYNMPLTMNDFLINAPAKASCQLMQLSFYWRVMKGMRKYVRNGLMASKYCTIVIAQLNDSSH